MKKLLITLIMFFSVLSANAADNVLQAVQIDGIKDTYNIILKSDDKAEIKKTIQAPNKMVIDLKGIRPSKSINTIYNNTASVDTVVVEPVGQDALKIFIQADNVSNAEITFDTLKTPLGVLNKPVKNENEIVLNSPIKAYTPVYNEEEMTDEDTSGLNLSAVMGSSHVQTAKKLLKDDKISWIVSFGLFGIILLSGIKAIKGKDNDIQVGLSQSLKERELNLYKELPPLNAAPVNPNLNYGIKAYQSGVKSPYVSADIPQRRPAIQPQAQVQTPIKPQSVPPAPSIAQNVGVKRPQAASTVTTKPIQKTSNIDSMKFLESMTKIYEKNGRADLAQGLKNNINKARTRV